MMGTEPASVTVAEAAALLGVSKAWVHRLVHLGTLPVVCPAWPRRVDRAAVMALANPHLPPADGMPMPDWAAPFIQVEGECWRWTGKLARGVTPMILRGGRNRPAARVLWEDGAGPVPAGRRLHRICGTAGCVRPTHQQFGHYVLATGPAPRRAPPPPSAPLTRACVACGTAFVTANRKRIYCSARCGYRAWQRRRAAAVETGTR